MNSPSWPLKERKEEVLAALATVISRNFEPCKYSRAGENGLRECLQLQPLVLATYFSGDAMFFSSGEIDVGKGEGKN